MLSQKPVPPTPIGTTLIGKAALVTGANTGLGFEAARQILLLQASRVIITARSESKGRAALQALQNDPEIMKTNPGAEIDMFQLDLNDFNSVIELSHKIKAELNELDILLNNAGVNVVQYSQTKDDHEQVMQVNCYSGFLLTLELLPLLKHTAAVRGTPSRVTFVGSGMMKSHTLVSNPVAINETVTDHFDSRETYAGLSRYSDSKFIVAAFVYEMTAHLSSSEVIVNSVCPGYVATDLGKSLPGWLRLILSVYKRIAARDVKEGARAYVYGFAVAGAESHGKFLSNNEIAPPPLLAKPEGKLIAKKVWNEALQNIEKFDKETFVALSEWLLG